MSQTFQPLAMPDTHVPALTIGLDLGDRKSVVCAVDAAGTVVATQTVATTPAALTAYFRAYPAARVVLEVGTHSPWVARLLTPLVAEVLVANPSAMYGRRRRAKRNDRLDAEFLARQGRADPALLHAIRHRSATAQADLALVRARDAVVRARTALINHVRGAVKRTGARLPAHDAHRFAAKVRAAVPAALTAALAPVLATLEALSTTIAQYDAQVEAVQRARDPVTARLRQIPGVGPLTALSVVLLLDDPTRFRDSRTVGAYFGLAPRLDESSAQTPQLGISKRGDALGRRLLVNAAHYILGPFGPPSALRRHGEALMARGGPNAKKRAVVAVARKLAVLLHHLWITGQAYVAEPPARPRAAA
jgi:transposase